MTFEEALKKLKTQKAKIIREKTSGNEYSLFITDDNQLEVITMSDIDGLFLSFKLRETITWKEVLSNDWEIIE